MRFNVSPKFHRLKIVSYVNEPPSHFVLSPGINLRHKSKYFQQRNTRVKHTGTLKKIKLDLVFFP